MKGRMQFETTCVGARGEDIIHMTDAADQISAEEFQEAVGTQAYYDLEISLGYRNARTERHPNGVRDINLMPLSEDYAVSFHRSTYRGRKCVYLVWSAIEYVFTDSEPTARGQVRTQEPITSAEVVAYG